MNTKTSKNSPHTFRGTPIVNKVLNSLVHQGMTKSRFLNAAALALAKEQKHPALTKPKKTTTYANDTQRTTARAK